MMLTKLEGLFAICVLVIAMVAGAVPAFATAELKSCPEGQIEVEVRVPAPKEDLGSGRGGVGFVIQRICVVDPNLDSDKNRNGYNNTIIQEQSQNPCLGAEDYNGCVRELDTAEILEEVDSCLRTAASTTSCFAPPAVTLEQVVERAAGEINVTPPEMNFGPFPDLIAVKYPVWLWITNEVPAPIDVTAGGISVHASAALKEVSWDMGEPVDVEVPGVKPAPVICKGPGVAPPPGVNELEVPECGYTYIWMSKKDRTDGTGKWTVTATATWEITWSSNTGQGDVIELQTTNSTTVAVGQWDVDVVPGPGG